MTHKNLNLNRRQFLSNAALIGASGTLGAGSLFASCSGGNKEDKYTPLRPAGEIYIPELPDKAMDGKPLKAALIGCGSRGTGAALNFLDAADNTSITVCADLFKDRLDSFRKSMKDNKNIEIADDKCFPGFDAYKKACDTDVDVDVVLITTPTLFHPEQLKYAIERGKHVFCEKPAAADVVGYRTFMTAVRQAQTKGLCIVPGTNRHYIRGYIEAYKKVQEGYIGRITSAVLYWNQGHLGFSRRRPEWTDMEYMIHDWYNWKWLSGDHLVEQFMHILDTFIWFSHLKPVRVMAMGSRQRRFAGDNYDNFCVDFEFEGGVHVLGMARQMDGCDYKIGDTIQGTKGSFSSVAHGGSELIIRDLDGDIVWQYDHEAAQKQFKQHNGYVLEHVDLINHIRSGKVINQAETTDMANLANIMARESAYTGKAFTWNEMIQSDMNFMPAELHLGNTDLSKYTIPVPGTSPVPYE